MSDQEREIRVVLLDGSEVIMNTGDRVLFQASRPGAIPISIDADGIIDDVLVALEESQQQRDIAQANYKTYYAEATEVSKRLAEAQQTIARQQENERSIIYEVSEIHKEAAAGNNGSLDRADIALNRIMLLSPNLLALGNKEGSDKA